jgi:hypothetical protein
MARVTGLEPATSGVTGRRSNQLSYTRVGGGELGAGPYAVKRGKGGSEVQSSPERRLGSMPTPNGPQPSLG